MTIALDITITEELKQEGVARELINRIQNLRKSSGFDVTDKIDVRWNHMQIGHFCLNESIMNLKLSNHDFIKSSLLVIFRGKIQA